jgi:large subunit ribosomal protein L13
MPKVKLWVALPVEVANVLRGKHKPEYTPHVDCGDFVVVVNAEKIQVSGKKEVQKMYRHHSGFPGGFKEESLAHLRARRPIAILEKAIRGMMPHNQIGRSPIHQVESLCWCRASTHCSKACRYETS